MVEILMESTFSRNRKLEASLAYNRKICGRSSIQTNQAACYAIAMVMVYMIQGKFVNNMCNVKSLKMQGNRWKEVLKNKWSHIEKCGSTCFLSFLQRKLQLAPPSSAAPCDKVCSGKSGKRNRWLLPPTMVPSLHALLARPH